MRDRNGPDGAVQHAGPLERAAMMLSGTKGTHMGMDLEPVKPSPNAPVEEYGIKWGRYNWSGWSAIQDYLIKWGVSLDGFSGSNDGDVIPEAKCREVADAIEAHIGELDQREQDWLRPHIALWRTCGGYRQF